MRDRRQAERYSLVGMHQFPVDAEVVDSNRSGLIVQSELPLVRGRQYRLDLRHADAVEPESHFSAIVVWTRQISAEPRYQVGFRTESGASADTAGSAVAIAPADGGVIGRIPWQMAGAEVDPPDRAFIARDLSSTGMLMELSERRPPAALFGIELVLGDQLFRCHAHAVRSLPHPDQPDLHLHGIEFLDVSTDQQSRLQRWLHSEHNHAVTGGA